MTSGGIGKNELSIKEIIKNLRLLEIRLTRININKLKLINPLAIVNAL